MAEGSEKRFHSIMDKLFYAPKSVPSSSRKRPNTSSALPLMELNRRGDIVERSQQQSTASAGMSQAPLCRPWDRGDLMKRLATFKSMTWFAKPKVVSAVNCARRGWVNVDMDIIACEACGARLLFSTPSSWTQQQVEKAALVFSLKLDNGHKLLCPWIDNACDETLARFPPMTPPVLVDKYRERCSALLEISALPVISSSAIEWMRSPQLELFLEQSSMQECGDGSAVSYPLEYLDNECNAESANLYYQAQKLISLCGWEYRSLPYVVNSKDGAYQSAEKSSKVTSSHIVTNRQNPSINLESAGIKEIMEADENANVSTRVQSDPNSVVLDCKLCGASVGLWAFSTISRPMELLRLVGYIDVNRENDYVTHDSGSVASNGAISLKERPSNLNLTIAGGPPPTGQNFKATISLPVIGRNLRARLSYDSEFRDRIGANQEGVQSDSQNKNLFQEKNDHTENTPGEQIVQQELGLIESEKHDELCRTTGNDQIFCLSHDISEKGEALGKENNNKVLLEATSFSGQEGSSPGVGMQDSTKENLIESTEKVVQSSFQNGKCPENLDNAISDTSAAEDPSSSQIIDPSAVAPEANVTSRNGENGEDDSSAMVASGNCSLQQLSGTEIQNKEGSLATRSMQTSENNEVFTCHTGKNLKRARSDNAMEFDPIRQHRHFCPWITSTDNGAPGWQQTLSALLRQKGLSPLPRNSQSAFIIEVDDPITSVRRLFMSPSAKRTKMSPPSS
ncbi:hypothetical protein I3842_15G110200 [Carya illinoinensis]|uniref:C3HC-type domain-containing protein n=2 Tax=Carya illinoinensis TaxID=32201 RepID=A0A922AAZ0_CARIL|nr:hypothetical protein I3842_15G110200 [Carya illinoinensis]KAG6675572.1 hypothetical protein I3842_15G110200 [Carya illinoinensis]